MIELGFGQLLLPTQRHFCEACEVRKSVGCMTTSWAKFKFNGILTSNAICPHGFMMAHMSKTLHKENTHYHLWNVLSMDSGKAVWKTSQKYLCKSLTMTLSSRSRIWRLFHPPTPDSDAFLQLPFSKMSFALMGAIQVLLKVNFVSLELSLRAECKPR